MSFALIILLFLPTLISSEYKFLERDCHNITCPSYKSNKISCDHIYHVQDPFTNECVAKCDGPCIDGKCKFCYCHSHDESALYVAPTKCDGPCIDGKCKFCYCHSHDESALYVAPTSHCKRIFMTNECNRAGRVEPPLECYERCDVESCGEGGTCSTSGRCVCHLGYRPDPTNPRICLKIPQNDNATVSLKSCHKGFKLNDDGECVPTCGDCKNGCWAIARTVVAVRMVSVNVGRTTNGMSQVRLA
ncbi:hypothetical protein QE152_g10356 [Popillia japonica]|uniref:Uncharacterized protein n=1 Tax=Popillia japonica TaxID=7064 RepID=A0AAW1LUI0_POPJA